MEKLVDLIAQFSRAIGHKEESAKEQFNFSDLTLTQMNYLETINQLHNPNLTELSVELGLTKPTVKVALDKLIEKEYIYRVRSDADRRSAHLHLTVKGKQINLMHNFAHQQMADMIKKNLNDPEIIELVRLLELAFQRQ